MSGETVTVVVAVALPFVFVAVRVKSVVEVGEMITDPDEVATLPMLLSIVALAAKFVLHASVDDWPAVIDVGEAAKERILGGTPLIV